jgi:hypothetical protein
MAPDCSSAIQQRLRAAASPLCNYNQLLSSLQHEALPFVFINLLKFPSEATEVFSKFMHTFQSNES